MYARPVPDAIAPRVLEPIEPRRYVHRRETAVASALPDVSEDAPRGLVPTDHLMMTPRASRGTDAATTAIASVERLGIHRHPLAKSLVAKKLLRRLVDDAAYLARSEGKGEQAPFVLRDEGVGGGDVRLVVADHVHLYLNEHW